MSGELMIVAAADLGGLGAAEGPGTTCKVSLPNFLPLGLPWLMVLLLFLPEANRRAQAWWVLVPLGLVAGGGGLVETIQGFAASSSEAMFLEVASVLAFGITVSWQLSPYLRRRHRLLTFLLTLVTMAGSSLVVLVMRQGADWGEGQSGPMALTLLACTLALSLGLALAGRACRRRFGGGRFCWWLLTWVAAFWVLLLTPFFVLARMSNGGGPGLSEFSLALLVAVGISLGTLVPFLVLCWWNGFYRERLKQLLHVEPEAPPVLATPPAGTAVS